MKDKPTKWYRIKTVAVQPHYNPGACKTVKRGESWVSAALFSHYEAKKLCKRINATGVEPVLCEPVPTNDLPSSRTVEGKVTH